ncbi:MAG TPA: hypothetical protein VIZ18_00900 [Ktedonobacteraceae bacterium]
MSSTSQPGATVGTGNPGTTTIPMPPTQTACPPAGTARAAVIRPLARGRDATIVYRKGPFGETFVRYDVVTHQKTTILSLNVGGELSQAQLSSDGQWLLFVAPQGKGQDYYNAIQMLRLDGQGLQTLYCSPATAGLSIMGMQWSLDDKTVIFSQGFVAEPPSYTVFVMDISKGIVQQELVKPASMMGFFAATWLDQTHVYLVRSDASGYPQALFLLDTTRGSQQNVNQLTLIRSPVPIGTFWSFDTSIDGSTIYTAQYQQPDVATSEGPSTISVQPATGGQPKTIYTDQMHAITDVRIMTRSLLAYVVDNHNSADTSENGLWMMYTDGTRPTRLTTSLNTGLNPYSQYTWSNFSRDGSMYAVEIDDGQRSALIFGSLTGSGPQTTLESESDSLVPGEIYTMVGWTTL